MIDDYEFYTQRAAESIHASPSIINYILANTLNDSITVDKDGVYRIAGLRMIADPNINRGKIEIR